MPDTVVVTINDCCVPIDMLTRCHGAPRSPVIAPAPAAPRHRDICAGGSGVLVPVLVLVPVPSSPVDAPLVAWVGLSGTRCPIGSLHDQSVRLYASLLMSSALSSTADTLRMKRERESTFDGDVVGSITGEYHSTYPGW